MFVLIKLSLVLHSDILLLIFHWKCVFLAVKTNPLSILKDQTRLLFPFTVLLFSGLLLSIGCIITISKLLLQNLMLNLKINSSGKEKPQPMKSLSTVDSRYMSLRLCLLWNQIFCWRVQPAAMNVMAVCRLKDIMLTIHILDVVQVHTVLLVCPCCCEEQERHRIRHSLHVYCSTFKFVVDIPWFGIKPPPILFLSVKQIWKLHDCSSSKTH